jgi:hypothetical protein
MKSVNIKGKEYVEVSERIKYFREHYEDGSIQTQLLKFENGICLFKAEVYVGEDLISTGHAYEKEGNGFINKDSFIENCETSAVGRALGIMGIGIDTSVRSALEMANASTRDKYYDAPSKLSQQEQKEMIQDFLQTLKLLGVEDDKVEDAKVYLGAKKDDKADLGMIRKWLNSRENFQDQVKIFLSGLNNAD